MKPTTPVIRTARYLSWVIAGILLLLPFHALFTTWLDSHTSHFDLLRIWKEIIIALLLLPAVWLVWSDRLLKKWLMGSWVVRLFLIYVILHLALGLWAYNRHEVNRNALIYALVINLRFIYFFILCAVIAAHSNFLKRYWSKIILWPASIVVLFGLAQHFLLPNDFLRHFGYSPKTILAYQTVDNNPDYPRLQSTLRGPNPLGAYLVLVIPAILAATRKARSSKIIDLALALIVLFYTYSRSAWIGTALALVLLTWWGLRKPQRKKLVWPLAIGIIVIGLGLFLGRHNQTVENDLLHTSSKSTSSQSSNAARSSDIKNGLRDVVHQPLGRGPGTAGPASQRNNHPPRNPEDYYLQLGQEVGVLGMVLFIAINLLAAKELWRRRDDNLARVLLVSLAGIAVVNLLLPAWTDDTLSLLWWGLAGIACAPVILKPRKQDGPLRLQKT